ncbi:MAG: VWA domain-containing protein [Treponemataceae bacterium]|nr:VWA domain-containing protein [Treponemataceae bacterium]
MKKASNFIFRTKQNSAQTAKNLRLRIIIKSVCYTLAWLCFIFAAAKPYWGTKIVPVQKNGNSISMVFDISWSMTAKDFEDKESSRLDLAKNYAKSLILSKEEVDDIASVSIIITKGNAFTLVPLTEDHNMIMDSIETLSPNQLISKGSNIAAGIEQAINSFVSNQARQNSIIVFTDGEESEGSIEKTIIQAINKGINVYIIGCGSKDGSEITVNAGKNNVHTVLKEENLENMIKNIKSSSKFPKVHLEYHSVLSENDRENLIYGLYSQTSGEENLQQVGYETKALPHHGLFIGLGLVIFIIGIFIGHYKVSFWAVSGLIIFLSLNSCTANIEQMNSILQGSFNWKHGNYQKAEVKFLKTLNEAQEKDNEKLAQYAVLGLGTSYASQNEELAAFTRLKSISSDAPDSIQFVANYDIGVLYFSQGNYEQALQYFQKALTFNPSSVDAKINYELSIKQISKDAQGKMLTSDSGKESHEQTILKDSIFSIIRENDKNIWKNQQQKLDSEDSLDY